MKTKTCYGDMDITVKDGKATLAKPGQPVATITKAGPYRSKLEETYAKELTALQYAQDIVRWWYEPVRLILAPSTTYQPDFLAQTKDGLRFYEVKGWCRDDAMVKLKVAAKMYPCFEFVLVTREKGRWVEQLVAPI
jgi:hypothetical protein